MSSDPLKGCYFRLKEEESALFESLSMQKDEVEKIASEVWNYSANIYMIDDMTIENKCIV